MSATGIELTGPRCSPASEMSAPSAISRIAVKAATVNEAISARKKFIAPVMVGSTVHFHGKLTRKFVKRGRQYTQREFAVTDAESGKLLLKHTAIALSTYQKVDQQDGDVKEQGNGSGN